MPPLNRHKDPREDYVPDGEGYSLRRTFRPCYKPIFEVSQEVPKGVICLVSALELQQITTAHTGEVWVAIANKARIPARLPETARVVRFSDESLEAGKRTVIVNGLGPITVHSPAKAIVDCFKFRRKLAEHSNLQLVDLLSILQKVSGAYTRRELIALRAIRSYLAVCRMSNVMAPYLEALEDRRISRMIKPHGESP